MVLNSQISDGSLKRSAQTENVLFSFRSATKQALQWILFLSFFCPSESLSPRRVRLKSSNSDTLEVMKMGQHQGGGSGFQRCRFWGGWVGGGSGVGGVDGGFVARSHASVPAAVALLLLDAGVVAGLIARISKVGQHVRP